MGTLLNGLGVAAGVAAVGGAGVAGSGVVTTGAVAAGGATAGGTAAGVGTVAAGGLFGGPPGAVIALGVVAIATAFTVMLSNMLNKKRQMEAAEEVTSRIDKLNYSDEDKRSAQYDVLLENRNQWHDSMEKAQTTDTAVADTIVGLLQKLVEKPVDRTVNSEITIESLVTTATQRQFEEMLERTLRENMEISV